MLGQDEREQLLAEIEDVAAGCDQGVASNPRYFAAMLAECVASTPTGERVALESILVGLRLCSARQVVERTDLARWIS